MPPFNHSALQIWHIQSIVTFVYVVTQTVDSTADDYEILFFMEAEKVTSVSSSPDISDGSLHWNNNKLFKQLAFSDGSYEQTSQDIWSYDYKLN